MRDDIKKKIMGVRRNDTARDTKQSVENGRGEVEGRACKAHNI